MSNRKHKSVPVYETPDMFEPQFIMDIDTPYIQSHPDIKDMDAMQLLNEMSEVQLDINYLLFDEYFNEKALAPEQHLYTAQVLMSFGIRLMSLRRLYINKLYSQN